MRCERRLITSWIGTFLSDEIQSLEDDHVKTVYRNSTKGWTKNNRNTQMISILLPYDFGSANFYQRREITIQNSIEKLKREKDLIYLFNNMLARSETLRDYLWVNDDGIVKDTNEVLKILPKETIISCIDWVIRDFWKRQSGWPDLFIFTKNDQCFVEVKSPHDELSLEQMNWFEWAINYSFLKCEICRVKKNLR